MLKNGFFLLLGILFITLCGYVHAHVIPSDGPQLGERIRERVHQHFHNKRAPHHTCLTPDGNFLILKAGSRPATGCPQPEPEPPLDPTPDPEPTPPGIQSVPEPPELLVVPEGQGINNSTPIDSERPVEIADAPIVPDEVRECEPIGLRAGINTKIVAYRFDRTSDILYLTIRRIAGDYVLTYCYLSIYTSLGQKDRIRVRVMPGFFSRSWLQEGESVTVGVTGNLETYAALETVNAHWRRDENGRNVMYYGRRLGFNRREFVLELWKSNETLIHRAEASDFRRNGTLIIAATAAAPRLHQRKMRKPSLVPWASLKESHAEFEKE